MHITEDHSSHLHSFYTETGEKRNRIFRLKEYYNGPRQIENSEDVRGNYWDNYEKFRGRYAKYLESQSVLWVLVICMVLGNFKDTWCLRYLFEIALWNFQIVLRVIPGFKEIRTILKFFVVNKFFDVFKNKVLDC